MEDESRALREASKAGDAACVALLLRAGGGGGIDEACPLGWTALHNAAFSGSAAVTCTLLAHGADLAARTKIGATALHVASFNGRLDVCKLLVVHGADVHATDRDGITPLEDARYRTLDRCCAVETPAQQWSKSAAFLAKVMPMPPDERLAFARRSWGLRAAELLQDAVSAGDGGQATLSALLDWLSGDVDARDHDGSTALHAAAEGGNLAAAALLLDRRASPGAATRVGETPLHFAAREGQPEVCRLLLDVGARADAPTRAGTTPVDEARRGGRAAHEEVRRLLDPEGRLRGEGPHGSANTDARST